MLEILKFIFSNPWIFLEVLILIITLGIIIVNSIEAWRE